MYKTKHFTLSHLLNLNIRRYTVFQQTLRSLSCCEVKVCYRRRDLPARHTSAVMQLIKIRSPESIPHANPATRIESAIRGEAALKHATVHTAGEIQSHWRPSVTVRSLSRHRAAVIRRRVLWGWTFVRHGSSISWCKRKHPHPFQPKATMKSINWPLFIFLLNPGLRPWLAAAAVELCRLQIAISTRNGQELGPNQSWIYDSVRNANFRNFKNNKNSWSFTVHEL